MTSSTAAPVVQGSMLAKLKSASSAEDFFTLLGVPYEAKVVDVARLHILKRMGQYLASEDFSAVPESVVAERCKGMLERAYADFVASSPIEERVFKILKDAVAPPKPANFVPLDALFK